MKDSAPDLSHYRILLVDDSPDLLNKLRRLLEVEGCTIVTATSREEALAHLQHMLFHIAVIDVRLVENDSHNRDGLQLVRDIRQIDPSIGVILMSVHADMQDVLNMVQPLPGKTDVFGVSRSYASRFLYKVPEELKKLPEMIHQVFQDVVQINWGLRIRDEQALLSLIPCNLYCAALPQPTPDQLSVELDELLRKLFAGDDRVDLQPISTGYSKAHVVQVDKYSQDVKGATQIAKIGEYPLIEREIRRYNAFIGRLTNANRHPAALMPIHRTRTLGGMIYTFLNLNGRIVDFAQVYQHVAQDKIDHLLNNLYTDTLSMQRGSTHALYPKANLNAIYTDLLRLNVEELSIKRDELLTGVKAIRKGSKFYLREGMGLLDPVTFMQSEPLLNDMYEAIIHGDLHGRNVLVDRRLDTWLIDFADLGRGPMLHDFISMEAWLLVNSTDQLGWASLLAWSKALFASRDDFCPPLPDSLASVAPVVKAHRSILTVRRLALDGRMGDAETARRAYLIGLLFMLLRMMSGRYLSSLKRFHALTSAALIAALLSTSPRKTGLLI